MPRLLDWTDDDGRIWRSSLPDDAPPDADPRHYSPIGPVDTSSLGLPDHIAVRLHNELHNRGLYSWQQLKHQRQSLEAAIRVAFQTTAESIIGLYYTDWQQGEEQRIASQQAVRSTVKANGNRQSQPQPQSRRR